MSKRRVKNGILAVSVAVLTLVSGIGAYFTATDTAKNIFNVEKVDVELEEPNYVDGTHISPNETVVKDPTVVNIETSDQFVFLSVKVPYENIITSELGGARNEIADTELFTWNTETVGGDINALKGDTVNYTRAVNDGWVLIETTVIEDTKEVEYIYAWATEDGMTVLGGTLDDDGNPTEGGRTSPLFNSVTMCNAVEGQGLENSVIDIDIEVLAIQSNDIIDGTNDPETVWNVYCNQNDRKTPALNEAGFFFNEMYSIYATEDSILPVGENSFLFKEDGTVDHYVNGNLIQTLDYIVDENGFGVPALGATVSGGAGGDYITINEYDKTFKKGSAVIVDGEYTYYFTSWHTYDGEHIGDGWSVIHTDGSGLSDLAELADIRREIEGYPVIRAYTVYDEWWIIDWSEIPGNSTEAITLEGDGQSFHKLAPSTLTFRSTAPLDDFKEVKINGQTIDESNYTLEEGSTIVTLKIDYLKTLVEDDYEITVVSEGGAPSAGFEVIEPDVNKYNFYYNQPYTAYVPALGYNLAIFIREGGTFDAIAYGNGSGVENCTYTVGGDSLNLNTSIGILHGTLSSDGKELSCAELGVTFRLGEESIVADENYIYIYEEMGNNNLTGYYVMAFDKTKSSYGSIRSNIYGFPVVQIGSHAFENCVNLDSFVIPDGITFISDSAFGSCDNLESITIPKSLVVINAHAFKGCKALSDIKFKGTVEQWNSIGKGDNWNRDLPATEVVCSDGVVSLN